MPIWAYNRSLGRIFNKAPADEEQEQQVYEVAPSSGSSGTEDFEVLGKVKSTAQNGTGRASRRNKKATSGR
jgi:hypothetical protein